AIATAVVASVDDGSFGVARTGAGPMAIDVQRMAAGTQRRQGSARARPADGSFQLGAGHVAFGVGRHGTGVLARIVDTGIGDFECDSGLVPDGVVLPFPTLSGMDEPAGNARSMAFAEAGSGAVDTTIDASTG